ncbi:hypothetical protein ACGFXB_33150 [Streptomyces canus]
MGLQVFSGLGGVTASMNWTITPMGYVGDLEVAFAQGVSAAAW